MFGWHWWYKSTEYQNVCGIPWYIFMIKCAWTISTPSAAAVASKQMMPKQAPTFLAKPKEFKVYLTQTSSVRTVQYLYYQVLEESSPHCWQYNGLHSNTIIIQHPCNDFKSNKIRQSYDVLQIACIIYRYRKDGTRSPACPTHKYAHILNNLSES